MQQIARLFLWVFVLGGMLALILAACSPLQRQPPAVSADVIAALSGEPQAGFARAVEPVPIVFPRDHGPHPEYQTEWWYYTGNLQDENGRRFGYQFTIFRSALTPELPARESDWATNQIYMAHFAMTDVEAGEHVSFERYSRGGADLAGATGEPAYSVWLEDWAVHEIEPGLVQMRASTVHPEQGRLYRVDLTLRETRTPIFHGDGGLSQKGPEPGNASYYYSLVNLETTGEIVFADRALRVEGSSWMDHEYGTSALSENALGWDWFSIVLDNGAILMFAQIRTEDGGRLDEFEGTLVYPAPAGNGNGVDEELQVSIRAHDFILEALDEWTSPTTGITYPSGWRVEIPARAIELEIEPLVRDQEMQTSFVYWEGAVDVVGTMSAVPVRGQGYVELTGYGLEIGDYQR